MSWTQILIVAAGVLVLGASVLFVWRGRRRELDAERATAATLERIAGTVAELHRSVAAPRRTGDEAPHLDLPVVSARVVSPAGSDLAASRLTKLRFQVGPPAVISAAGNVVNMWEHITREAGEDDSYRSVLGPVFDDAVYHAANAGVMDREQAEALVFWADSTAALARPVRAKSSLIAQIASGDGSTPRAEART